MAPRCCCRSLERKIKHPAVHAICERASAIFPREPAARHYTALRGATSPQPAQLDRLGRDDRGDLAADGAELVENPGHDLLDSC